MFALQFVYFIVILFHMKFVMNEDGTIINLNTNFRIYQTVMEVVVLVW